MNGGSAQGYGAGVIILMLVLAVVMIASGWKIFTKAGKPGWAVIIPIYNLVVLLEIIQKPLWWIILFLIPFVNLVVLIIAAHSLVRHFGKPGWHVILYLIVPIIYLPYLGFGSAQYQQQI